MGIRETLNEKPAITTGVVSGLILLALILIVYQCWPEGGGDDGVIVNKAFFSTDDGKTYFADDSNNIPPYTVNKQGDPNHGKIAVRAQVWRCAGGPPFVSHLEKYSDEDKKRLTETMKQAQGQGSQLPLMYMSMGQNMMVKKPGVAGPWIRLSANTVPQYTAITSPKCPDGSIDTLERVMPEG